MEFFLFCFFPFPSTLFVYLYFQSQKPGLELGNNVNKKPPDIIAEGYNVEIFVPQTCFHNLFLKRRYCFL